MSLNGNRFALFCVYLVMCIALPLVVFKGQPHNTLLLIISGLSVTFAFCAWFGHIQAKQGAARRHAIYAARDELIQSRDEFAALFQQARRHLACLTAVCESEYPEEDQLRNGTKAARAFLDQTESNHTGGGL